MKKIFIPLVLICMILVAGYRNQMHKLKVTEKIVDRESIVDLAELSDADKRESDGLLTQKRAEYYKMIVRVDEKDFTATLEDNDAAKELVQILQTNSITIDMQDYSGFEKVGSLGRSLTTSNTQMVTEAGDIVLYNRSQIVLFYGSNTWSYTKIGSIDDLNGWKEALGSGDLRVTFLLGEE